MPDTPDSLVAEVGDLVSLPDVYLRVRRALEDPNGSAAGLARAVSHDPALTTRFLRVANSPVYAPKTGIETVSRAVATLGTQLVHDIVLAASVAEMFAGLDPAVMDVRTFWARSVNCGVLAKLIAEDIGVLDNEHVFIEGLLADIGHMVLYLRRGTLMEMVLRTARATRRHVAALEREELGFDYTAVSAALARQWELPGGLEAVLGAVEAPGSATRHTLEAAIVHSASRLAGCDPDSSPDIDAAAVALTERDPAALVALRDASRPELESTVATFVSLAA